MGAQSRRAGGRRRWFGRPRRVGSRPMCLSGRRHQRSFLPPFLLAFFPPPLLVFFPCFVPFSLPSFFSCMFLTFFLFLSPAYVSPDDPETSSRTMSRAPPDGLSPPR